jgi:hypothetical protein
MGMGRILEQYRTQFPDDRATFGRWLKANAVIGSILAAGMIVMAVAGSQSRPPHDVAGIEKAASDIAATPRK